MKEVKIMRLIINIVTYTLLFYILYKLYRKQKILKILKFKNVEIINYKDYIPKKRESALAIKKHKIKSDLVSEVMDYYVILPNNYDNMKKYPVLFFLHGLGDSAIDWIEKAKLLESYDTLINNNKIKDMILVLPESGANGRSWYTNWYNISNKKYEDFFTDELINDIQKKYNIDTNNMGVTGFSMGGYGAYKLALKHLDKYKSIASLAGAINFPRLFSRLLKGFGLLKHLKLSDKNQELRNLRKIFGKKIRYSNNENVFTLLKRKMNENIELVKSKYFYLSVGEYDNKGYTMLLQWEDIVEHMEKHHLNYEARLVKGEGHRWEYVEKEIESVLLFHSKHFD
jgi:S-formylglutathione hydrolase FrmB